MGPRRPLSPAVVRAVAIALEGSMLVALVGLAAGGALSEREEPPRLPIELGPWDAPALALALAHVIARPRLARAVPRVPPFVLGSAAVLGAAAAAHPSDGRGALASLLLGLAVGAFFGWLVPLHAIPAALGAEDGGPPRAPRPWRELHAAATLVILGALSGSVRGGALVAVPAVGLGVGLLARGAILDAAGAARAAGRWAALARVALGLGLALLGLGLGAVVAALSLGRLPPG